MAGKPIIANSKETRLSENQPEMSPLKWPVLAINCSYIICAPRSNRLMVNLARFMEISCVW